MITSLKPNQKWFYIGFSYNKDSYLKLKLPKAVSIQKLQQWKNNELNFPSENENIKEQI